MKIQNELSLDELTTLCDQRLKTVFATYYPDVPAAELKNAMEYTLTNGGKHLRPMLVYATGRIFNTPWENLDVPAAAIELIHTYSLIHDDLPAMDNADLRRGKPSCHKTYGDAIAVLTGDALLTLAMQLIAMQPSSLSANKRLQMMACLTQAAGPYGMVAGQALDIAVMHDGAISAPLLHDVYRLKTGRLFSACVELGRLASGDEDEFNQEALTRFANCIGLAFQIQDDILDIESHTNTLGKQQGIDSKNNKLTYPHLLGINEAKDKVKTLYDEAFDAIHHLGNKALLLRELAESMRMRGK